MAFVREKVSRGRRYFYLVENRREGGKVRQRVLGFLGYEKTLEAAIAYWHKEAAEWRGKQKQWEAKAREWYDWRMWCKERWPTVGDLPGETRPRMTPRGHPHRIYWQSMDEVVKCRARAEKAEAKVRALQGLANRGIKKAGGEECGYQSIR